MKVVIVEDEKLSAEHLTLLLQKTDSNIEVVEYAATVKEVVNLFKGGLQADLLFLDIHLADGNSFEIFPKIQTDIPIIFTTAYDNYAIQAFKQNSIDYLLKPISLKDLQFALEKFKKQHSATNKQIIENITTAYRQMNKQYKSRFLVKRGQTIDTIQTDEIHHFETQESISFLVTDKGNRYIIDYTLEQLETILNPKDFFRINRKIIIHIQSVEKVNIYLNSRLAITAKQLEGDTKVVSRERVNDFKKWLDN
jgi:DNA-binding LytR/AlgR family response regulator